MIDAQADGGSDIGPAPGPTAAGDADPGARLVALWQGVAARMADLPIYNPRLDVHTTAFRRHGAWRIGVVTTPWFMNVVAVPDVVEALPPAGHEVAIELPDGVLDAIAADLDGFGRLAMASLFSPMDDFADTEATMAVAEAALEELLAPPPPPPKPAMAVAVDRRALLFGRRPEARP